LHHAIPTVLCACLMCGACSTAPTAPPAGVREDPSPAVSEPTDTPATEPARPLRVVGQPDDASGQAFALLDAQGAPVTLPEPVASHVAYAQSPTLVLGQSALLYDHGGALFLHRLDDGSTHPLASHPEDVDLLAYGWAHDDSRALALIWRAADGPVTLRTLRLDAAGDPTGSIERAMSPAPLIRCASVCYVVEARFAPDGSFEYLVRGGPEDPSADPPAPKVFEAVSLPNP
jgi:hypothetical protein